MTLFTKSPQAVKEYEKIGLPYPNELADMNHEQFLQQTSKSPDPLNFCIITKLKRIRASYINPDHNKLLKDKEQIEGIKPREYLLYSLLWHRTDPLGNIRHSWQPNIGIGPKLQPVMRIKKDANGWEEKYIASASIIGKSYYYPYTGPESVKKLIKEIGEDSLRDLSTDEGRRKATGDQMKREEFAAKNGKVVYQPQEKEYTQFSISSETSQMAYSVSSFEDFCNASYEDLVQFGFTPTKEERENRLAADEVARAQRLAALTDANIADELDKAAERRRSGVPYR